MPGGLFSSRNEAKKREVWQAKKDSASRWGGSKATRLKGDHLPKRGGGTGAAECFPCEKKIILFDQKLLRKGGRGGGITRKENAIHI